MTTAENDNLVTRLLSAWRDGDADAPELVLNILYDDLHALAVHKLGRSSPPGSLQPSDLVHEAYIRLLGSAVRGWEDRRHFVAAAVTAMRSVIVDRARARTCLKRGGVAGPLTRAIDTPATALPHEQVLAIHAAITRLESIDARAASMLTLRCFGGLSLAEAALTLDITERTARRDWEFARRWLRVELQASIDQPGAR